MKYTHFRNWVHNLWMDNCEEHFEMKVPKYSKSEYFKKFKWWLKREYKHQKVKDAVQRKFRR